MSDIIYRIKRKYKNQNDFELFRLNKNKIFSCYHIQALQN